MRKTFTRLMAVGTLAAAALAAPSAHALPVLGFADVVLSYPDSGAGPFAGPYGGLGGISGAFPVSVPLSVVLGSDVAGSERASCRCPRVRPSPSASSMKP